MRSVPPCFCALAAVLASRGNKASIAPASVPFRHLILYPLQPVERHRMPSPEAHPYRSRGPVSSVGIAAAVGSDISCLATVFRSCPDIRLVTRVGGDGVEIRGEPTDEGVGVLKERGTG